MAKNILIIVLTLVSICLVYYLFFSPPKPGSLKTVNLTIKDTTYQIEIAQSLKEKSVGLSNRRELCQKCGMIFPYNKEGELPFWMKDTLIPLDMIWLNKNGKVIYFVTAIPQPQATLNQLTIYQNSTPAQYVLELNAGDFSQLNLKMSDIIDLSPLESRT